MATLGIQHFAVFVVSAILISLLPGPATLYIVGRSMAQGRRAGLLSVLGIGAGSLFHITAVAFGLSAVIAASHLAFLVIKTLGAAYLIYLGVNLIRVRAKTEEETISATPPAGDRRVFTQGLVTQILNPKASLFFLAILPQFVSPGAERSPLPFLALGAAFVTIDTLWFSTLALFTAFATDFLRRSRRVGALFRKATGALYVGLGLALLRERAAAGH